MLSSVPKSGFRDVQILVVGDLMLDQYVDGDVRRISPEAPVPVLSVKKRRAVPGGAANVALNVTGLQANVLVAGVIGDDAPGRHLSELLAQHGVNTAPVIEKAGRPTTSKTRIISGNHQIVRLDEELTEDLDQDCAAQLVESVASSLDRNLVSAVILSDYGKGALSGTLPQLIIEEGRRRAIPVFVDPKRYDYSAYRGATCVTPNQKEFRAALVAAGIQTKDLASSGLAFREQLECTALLVTQGAEGMTLFTAAGAKHLAALAEEVFDVSGAGDTVIAALSVAVGSGLPFEHAVELANLAASIVIRHAGTTPIAWPELSGALGLESPSHARANTFSAGDAASIPD